MSAGVVFVVAIGILIVVAGPLIAHYSEKASARAEAAEKAGASEKTAGRK